MGLVNSKPNKIIIIPGIDDIVDEFLPIKPEGYMNKATKPTDTKYRILNKKIYNKN